jgi:asparagine synthase (glutamine-hydrolysing)
MCGIAGVVDFSGREVDATLVPAMCRAIAHRGPDDEGIITLPRPKVPGRPIAVLASRRLSIIDVAGGHQPIANEDETIWAVLNGEIYNFQELRDELRSRGHRFRTRSDTEVLVHLYEDRGADFAAALDGMFAFAIWDSRNEELVLGRDRFGKKPLVYADRGRRIHFASELQALTVDPDLDTRLDLDALDYYLTHMAVPAPLTIYRGVRKLPPAHIMRWNRHGTTLQRYWSLAYTPKLALSEAEACERTRDLLRAAVRKRLLSEVPLGAFLSGGVDSSGVVALMAGLMNQPVKTFSIGFEEERYNELPHARRVAELYGCDHHEFVVKPNAIDVLPLLARHYGEPYADSSALPSYYLAKLTRQHVTVALNGDGGDEAFAGYGWHRANRMAERWQQVPAPVRRATLLAARALVPSSGDRRSLPARARRFLQGVDDSRANRYRAWAGVFNDEQKHAILVPGLRRPSHGGIVDALFAQAGGLDAVDAMLSVDTAFYLPTDLLAKMDIASMASSLEARSPLLDHSLVEFVARLPSNLKIHRGTSKYLLKRALSGLVPPENLRRAKRGFAVPIADWIRGDMREFVNDHLLGRRFAERGPFAAAAVRSMLDLHQKKVADYAHHIWILLMFEVWSRECVDARRASPEPAVGRA